MSGVFFVTSLSKLFLLKDVTLFKHCQSANTPIIISELED